jgi:hypothetical protein
MVIIVGYVKNGVRAERVISVPVKSVSKKEKAKEMRSIAEGFVAKDAIQYVMEVDDTTLSKDDE